MPTTPYKNSKGERIQGVTTIISQNCGWGKGALMYWSNQKGLKGIALKDAQEEATIPGTIAHAMIEAGIRHRMDGIYYHWKEFVAKLFQCDDSQVKAAENAYLMYLEWAGQWQMEPVAVEPHLVCEEYQYGATPDLIARTKNGLALIDWKSGRTYSSLFLQLAAYKYAWEYSGSGPTDWHDGLLGGFHVLRISKDEDNPHFHHSHWMSLPPEAWEAFKAALTLSRAEGILKKLL